MVASSLALPTSFRTTARLQNALGKCFLSAEGRDSRLLLKPGTGRDGTATKIRDDGTGQELVSKGEA